MIKERKGSKRKSDLGVLQGQDYICVPTHAEQGVCLLQRAQCEPHINWADFLEKHCYKQAFVKRKHLPARSPLRYTGVFSSVLTSTSPTFTLCLCVLTFFWGGLCVSCIQERGTALLDARATSWRHQSPVSRDKVTLGPLSCKRT